MTSNRGDNFYHISITHNFYASNFQRPNPKRYNAASLHSKAHLFFVTVLLQHYTIPSTLILSFQPAKKKSTEKNNEKLLHLPSNPPPKSHQGNTREHQNQKRDQKPLRKQNKGYRNREPGRPRINKKNQTQIFFLLVSRANQKGRRDKKPGTLSNWHVKKKSKLKK